MALAYYTAVSLSPDWKGNCAMPAYLSNVALTVPLVEFQHSFWYLTKLFGSDAAYVPIGSAGKLRTNTGNRYWGSHKVHMLYSTTWIESVTSTTATS